jgi:hypothetical protein
MHNPILANANRPVLTDDAVATADAPMCCGGCLATLRPDGACVNVGQCHTADASASRLARGETFKSRRQPLAFTIGGGVD